MDPSPAAPPRLARPPAPQVTITPAEVWDTLSAEQQQQVLKLLTRIGQELLRAKPPDPEVPHD